MSHDDDDFFGAQPSGLDSGVMNLTRFLRGEIKLFVPRYQRPYSWTEEHVSKLIQDFMRAWERGGALYFIGEIVLVRKGPDEWHLADGQQRLTTLTMFLAYLRDRLAEHGDRFQRMIVIREGRPRLRLRPADEAFFHFHVQTPDRFAGLAQLDETSTDSQGCMSVAAEVITNALAGLPRDKLLELARFACGKVLFNVTKAEDPSGAALVFGTINDRGQPISKADLMKSALLDRARMSEEEKDRAAQLWEELEDRLGREAFAQLLELTPAIFHGNHDLLAPGDLGAFTQSLEDREAVESFLTDWLPRHGQALIDIREEAVSGPYAFEINRRIHCLKLLIEQTWLPMAVSFLANHGKDHEKTRAFFRGVDLIAYATMFAAVLPHSRDARWKRVIEADGDPKKLFDEHNGVFALTPQERDRLAQRLGAPFKGDRSAEAEKRKLILIRINACLPGGEVLIRGMDLTVEHILPAKGGPDWNDKFTPEERSVYAHLIGNWTLIPLAQNQRCGNRGFAHKRKIYYEEGAPVYAVTRMFERVQEWTKLAIDARTSEMQAALYRDWGLIPPSR
ncbi:MAG: DUF262 domain-containing protein [Hydrogenophilaceae bacterium]|jgi:hypothetical protein|nr:DUF262 domain-containing protein [Hydrogenophilaceae bacterium]